MNKNIKILLIEDNPGDARLIREILQEINGESLDLKWMEKLKDAIVCLKKEEFDIILTDLSLPDSQDLNTLHQLLAQAQARPIVILTGLNDMTFALKAVNEGAQDYLIKEDLNSFSLNRSIQYAIERQKAQETIRAMSYIDELTGLYNRRGFHHLAHQQLTQQNRTIFSFCLLFADLDSMKWINDQFGHREGDAALKQIAQIFRKSFRGSDVIARIGGDEFVVLVMNAENLQPFSFEYFSDRLQRNIHACNHSHHSKYPLSLSLGIAYSHPDNPLSIDDLLAKADASMYERKKHRLSAENGGVEAVSEK